MERMEGGWKSPLLGIAQQRTTPMKSINSSVGFIGTLLGVLAGMPGVPAQQEKTKVGMVQGDALPANPLDLNEKTYAALRDYILPKPQELRWQQIPWRATWADALAAAKKENKPIYVWAMNGHPLGNC